MNLRQEKPKSVEGAYADISHRGRWDDAMITEEFQNFIDDSSGLVFKYYALMNICKPIDISLMNGQKPYPTVFSEILTIDLK